MIPLYKDDGTRLAVVFPAVTLNNPNDPTDDTYEINNVSTSAQYDTSIDSSPGRTGAIVSPARRVLYIVRIDGTARAPTFAKLADKKAVLAAALDPDLLSRANPTTFGFVNMDFSVPTTDTAEYASGLIPSRLVVRPRSAPLPLDSQYTGTASFFTVELIVADPRRVYQTLESLVGAGTATNKGNTYAAVTVSIAMSGAGASGYAIDRVSSGVSPLVLNLSTMINGDTVTVDMDTKTIRKNGTETPGLYVSGGYFDLAPGANTISLANTTNATTTTQWRRSWVA